MKDQGKLSSELYSHLYPTSEKIPKLYCLPKIHKRDVPFRPIVDYTGSVGYNTSRYLADILGPLVGQTDSFVKNSQHTASELISLELEEDDILELLEFVLTTTYFAFRGEIYRQKFGTAMGLSLIHI